MKIAEMFCFFGNSIYLCPIFNVLLTIIIRLWRIFFNYNKLLTVFFSNIVIIFYF